MYGTQPTVGSGVTPRTYRDMLNEQDIARLGAALTDAIGHAMEPDAGRLDGWSVVFDGPSGWGVFVLRCRRGQLHAIARISPELAMNASSSERLSRKIAITILDTMDRIEQEHAPAPIA